MKLDKIMFARLIALITSEYKYMHDDFVKAVDDLIDIEVPEPQIVRPSNENVERLMALMVEGTKKIDAIREHRTITGMGLKESKDAVERYWNIKMSAETLKDRQLNALQRILDDCSPDLHQFNEEEIQIIKRWIESFSV